MLDRLLILSLGVCFGWLLRDHDPRRGSPTPVLPSPSARRVAEARAALRRLNHDLPALGGRAGPTFASAPDIEEVARVYGSALAAAEDAHAEIVEAWGRFPSSQSLAMQDEAMAQKRLELANATIAAVLQAPDVQSALSAIRGQITDLRAAAQRMEAAVTETTAVAAAVDAVAGVAGLTASFNG